MRSFVHAVRWCVAWCALAGWNAGCSSENVSPARQHPSQGNSGASAGAGAGAGAAGGVAAGAPAPNAGQPTSGAPPPPPSVAGSGAGAAAPGGFAAQPTPPDPDITFEWMQTRPGQGECQAGRYSGVFSCEYSPAPDVPGVLVTGPVEFVLERSQNGEFLEIADGRLDGLAQLVFGFSARLAGQLDCSTNRLQADAVDGVWGFGDPSALPLGTFEGTLTGELDRASVTLSGEWNLYAADVGTCIGPWDASFTP